MGGDDPLHGFLVVVGQDHHRVGGAGGHAPGPGHRNRGIGGPGFLQGRGHADFDAVVVAVVPAFELGDLRPAAELPGEAHRVQGRLGSGVAEADAVEGGDAAAHLLGHLDLVPHARPESYPPIHLACDRRHDRGVVVPEHLRGVVIGEIEVAVAVDVPQALALAPLQGQRKRRVEIGPLHTAGHYLAAALEQLPRTRVGGLVAFGNSFEFGVQGSSFFFCWKLATGG